MTGMLQDLLHERADELGTPHVDLATITRDGERRVRRRRTAVVRRPWPAAVVHRRGRRRGAGWRCRHLARLAPRPRRRRH